MGQVSTRMSIAQTRPPHKTTHTRCSASCACTTCIACAAPQSCHHSFESLCTAADATTRAVLRFVGTLAEERLHYACVHHHACVAPAYGEYKYLQAAMLPACLKLSWQLQCSALGDVLHVNRVLTEHGDVCTQAAPVMALALWSVLPLSPYEGAHDFIHRVYECTTTVGCSQAKARMHGVTHRCTGVSMCLLQQPCPAQRLFLCGRCGGTCPQPSKPPA